MGANRLRSNGINKQYCSVVFRWVFSRFQHCALEVWRGIWSCGLKLTRSFYVCILHSWDMNSSRLFRFVMYCTERFVFLNYYVMFYIVLIDCFSQRVLPCSRLGFRVMEWNLHLWSENFGRCFCHTSRFQNTSNIGVLKIYRHHRIDYILLEIELPFTFFLPSK